jgi:hypothetical protein
MKIDIDQLTEAELIGLNHRIVVRLRFLTQGCSTLIERLCMRD